MSNDFNSCTFTGRLGADPEVRYGSQGGGAVANFRIAVSEAWKDKEGAKKEKVEWIKIVTFGKLAEVVEKYLKKGQQVLISGKLQNRQWEDKDKNIRYTTEVVASVMQMLGKKENKPEEEIPF